MKMRVLKRIIAKNLVVIVFCLALLVGFLYYLIRNRHPNTDNAFVIANVRPVSALVPGYVTDVYVKNNQYVRKGDKLFTVYRRRYKLAVEKTEHEIKAMEYDIQALEAGIERDRHVIEQKKSQSEYARYRAEIQRPIAANQLSPEYEMQELNHTARERGAGLKIAEATLLMNQKKLEGLEAKLKSLRAELEVQKIDLEQTTVYALENGSVCNMYLSKGTYVEPGEPLFAFIETDRWWVQANIKETMLGNVRPGQRATVVLSIYPDRTFSGTVDQIGWGVNRQLSAAGSALPEVEKENEWYLLPQRFPVHILIEEPDRDLPMHIGASAYVTIETRTGRGLLPPR